MKLIRSGGVNARLRKNDASYNTYGFGNYLMLQIKPELEELISHGEKVALCVAAKADQHTYDQHITDLGFDIDRFTILGREDDADWSQYSAILLLGGETKELYSWLNKTGFELKNLKRCRMLAGDSAGAYVLSGKTLLDYEPDGSSFKIVNGFLPELHQLVAAHVNNPHYHAPDLTEALNKWCRANAIEYIGLQENEINVVVI